MSPGLKVGKVTIGKMQSRKLRDVYKNKPEERFRRLAHFKEVDLMKRGYPDFMVIRNEEIVGFVEVKPYRDKDLKYPQQLFAKFCKKYNIPFFKWTPEDKFPKI